VERILVGAHRVLLDEGHQGFTTRRVAEAAGIAPGNLSYHFPTKTDLLRALIDWQVAEYAAQFKALLTDAELPPGKELETLVAWLLADASRAETVRMFRELWAIALHDELIQEAVDDLYDELMEGVVPLLRRSRPEIGESAVREMVQLLALLSEGTIVLYGAGRKRAVSLERIIEIVPPLLESMVQPGRVPGT
jgi:AcrR family transcriptional regulator